MQLLHQEEMRRNRTKNRQIKTEFSLVEVCVMRERDRETAGNQNKLLDVAAATASTDNLILRQLLLNSIITLKSGSTRLCAR